MGIKIALIGEAWGATEEAARAAFQGPSGQELTRMLADAGINRGDCFLSNVFNIHPPNNDLKFFGTSKKLASKRFSAPLTTSAYLKPEFEPEIDRLYSELEAIRPNIAILLGNTACWALLGKGNISKTRGTVTESPFLPWLKCIPAYHPAAVLRQYELRHVTVLDFLKAKRHSEFPEVRRTAREIWMDPTLEDLEFFYKEYVLPAKRMAFDIETNYSTQITCIGFAPSIDRAIVIPFYDYRKPSGSFWETLQDELLAWDWVAKYLDSPCEKVAQNGLFDMQHLWFQYGIPVRNPAQDTMLLHHSLQPESPKALDFLASVYCDEAAWKTHRPRGRDATIKRED